MPRNVAHRKPDDEDSINRQDESRRPSQSGIAASTPMAATIKTPSTSQPSENLTRGESAIAKATQSEIVPQQQKGLLQVPASGAQRRPVETSIWDWEAPLQTVSESSPYLFEPQGELLQEQQHQQPIRADFSIPQAVPGSGVNWSFQNPTNRSGSDGFAIPRRPTPGGLKRKSISDQASNTSRQPDLKKTSRAMSESGEEALSPTSPRPTAGDPRLPGGQAGRVRSGTDASMGGRSPSGVVSEALRPSNISGGTRRMLNDPTAPMVLPARKVFPIQIGDRLFRLSGASISSDAPSYFSQFFEEQLRQNEGAENVRTLYIDRDPATFEDISLHLQGYHVKPRDGPHFVKLFADAQFFSLPRLTQQLFDSTIYIRIGDEEFQIPRDLFSNPGDSPNYFSLGFSIFFTTPTDVFPGLSQRSLLRPPSILPPSVPNRSARTFADLLHILKGYPVEIRNEEHRAELLRDARYFHLKGLEQKIIPHQISYNLLRQKSEILIRLEDIRQSGISFVPDIVMNASTPSSPSSNAAQSVPTGPGWIHYQRPYVDSEAYSLVVEIGGEESTFLSIGPALANSPARVGRASFHNQTLSRITSLFSVIANKMNLPITQPLGLMMMERGSGVAGLPVSPGNTGVSEDHVKIRIGPDADVVVDGEKWTPSDDADDDDDDDDDDDGDSMTVDPAAASSTARGKQRQQEDDEGEDWVVRKAQWRIRVQPASGGVQSGRSGMEVIMGAVKIEAVSSERGRNAVRRFLT